MALILRTFTTLEKKKKKKVNSLYGGEGRGGEMNVKASAKNFRLPLRERERAERTNFEYS